jgi:pilus assembly protein Flp/PilA
MRPTQEYFARNEAHETSGPFPYRHGAPVKPRKSARREYPTPLDGIDGAPRVSAQTWKKHVAFLMQDCYLGTVQGRRARLNGHLAAHSATIGKGYKSMVQQVWQKVRSLVSDEKGVSALEYAVLAVGIVLAVVAAASTLGGAVSGLFNKIGSSL